MNIPPSMISIRLRKAVSADCKPVWVMLQDPVVRRAAFVNKEILWEEHSLWYEASLRNTSRKLIIITDEEEHIIGQVRFDFSGTVAEVSIVLGREFRGHGYGSYALNAACEQIKQQGMEECVAYIKQENRASIRAFQKAGFILDGSATVKGCHAVRMRR